MQDDPWLDRRYDGGDLPAAAERALHAIGQDWQDEAASEAHLYAALDLAPGHLAAYKFYFCRHRLQEALPCAQACLAHTLRRNNLPADWRAVQEEDAAFSSLDPEPRMFLFARLAYG